VKVLGIDPGTETLGFGLVWRDGTKLRCVEAGILHETGPLAIRLANLYGSLGELIVRLAPDEVAIEEVFYGQNIQTAIRLGQAQATALIAAARVGLTVSGYPPASVKQSLTGNGRAHKRQVQQMVCRLLALDSAPALDASDALAVAITHIHHSGRRRLDDALAAATVRRR
jgi:crossover junction endodeoxyribonuclease RuvC